MRKAAAKRRDIEPDPRFGDPMVTRFINNLMFDGKKSTGFKVFYASMDKIQEIAKEETNDSTHNFI